MDKFFIGFNESNGFISEFLGFIVGILLPLGAFALITLFVVGIVLLTIEIFKR